MRYSIAWHIVLLVLTSTAVAGTGDGSMYIKGGAFYSAAALPCSRVLSGDKMLMRCAAAATNKNGFNVEVWFPRMAQSVSTFNAAFTANANSTDTAKRFAIRCQYVVSTTGAIWTDNDEPMAGATYSGWATGAITGTANADITVTVGPFTAYNQTTDADCASVAACKDRHGVLHCQRASDAEQADNVQVDLDISGARFIYDTP